MSVKAWIGTSGYSYPEWKGNFYPEKMAAKDMLRFYGEKFPTVEINNTFYRMPKEDVLKGWAEQVPEHFAFVIKASQRITHMQRLKECGELLLDGGDVVVEQLAREQLPLARLAARVADATRRATRHGDGMMPGQLKAS